jgi:hypothetical protein
MAESDRVKYWEIIADNLKKAGWSYGYVSAVDCEGRTIWIADAHRDGPRFIVRADKKLTAFMELEAAVRNHQAHSKPKDTTRTTSGNPVCLGLLNLVKNSVDIVWLVRAGLHPRQVRWASPQELHLTLFPQG